MTDRRSFGIKQRLRIYSRQNGLCAICKEIIPHGRFDIDHAVPLALGGTNDDANLRAVHQRCNAQKAVEETKAVRKSDRIAAGGRTRRGAPMAGSRNSPWKRLMTGETVRR